MKIKEGMYVRYLYSSKQNGKCDCVGIDKIDKISEFNTYHVEKEIIKNLYISEEFIVKASYDITDLIERNDIILGKDGLIYQVDKVWKDYVFTKTENEYEQIVTLVDYQIDKILTHEQFENRAYKVD